MTETASQYYAALVDMGSNGIRFSITDLTPSTSRILPVIYQDRAGISLFDVQYNDTGEKVPIPQSIIKQVLKALQRFKRTCASFGVPQENIRILATEATRQALNSEDYRSQIKDATGWDVTLLPKEEEGRVGAMGVASSFATLKGLMMDLGGGSTQITWLISETGDVRMSPAGSISMPYGAAALSRRLIEADAKGKKGRQELQDEVTKSFQDAIKQIALPSEFQKDSKKGKGLKLYLSGGGFRGWGFVLMSQHPVSPYPIPVINGFQVDSSAFHDTTMVQTAVVNASASESDSIFRVSDRRASQVPAVAFLVSCLKDTLPSIDTVYFCQGGVREGSFFMNLPRETKAEHPLISATRAEAPQSADALLEMLKAAIPQMPAATAETQLPDEALLRTLVHTMHAQADLPKDLRASSALRTTTTGHLAGVHGATHFERAWLALSTCERHGGRDALSPSDERFFDAMQKLLKNDQIWWTKYIGCILRVLGDLYPAGVVDESDSVKVSSEVESVSKIRLAIRLAEDDVVVMEGLEKSVRAIIKVGKKKRWPNGRGFKVDVDVETHDGKTVDGFGEK